VTIRTLLIANRGEIARRIIVTCRSLGIRTVAVFSDADSDARHVSEADEAVHIGAARAADSYLNTTNIIAAALRTGAEAIHPGYGFLAENADFAQAVTDAGVVFIGPGVESIRLGADKQAARELMAGVGVPVLPGVSLHEEDIAALTMEDLEFPLLVKAAAGGGGRGMRRVNTATELPAAIAGARREAESAFGDGRLYVEELVVGARHVEVQVLGDSQGNIVHLGERECTIQRRYQKLIEESPSPSIDHGLREEILRTAIQCAQTIEYVGAGTVEFVIDQQDRFYFIEFNTRLQVEHTVTEVVTGLDIVALQIRIAQGAALPSQGDLAAPVGHSIEARVYAEDTTSGFLPQAGTIHHVAALDLPGIRIDSAVAGGESVGTEYDSLLMKVVSHGDSRAEATARLRGALKNLVIHGPPTNVPLLVAAISSEDFSAAAVTTGWLEENLEGLVHSPDAAATRLDMIAAAHVAQYRRRASATTMASIPSGWRNVPTAPQSQDFTTRNGQTVTVTYTINGSALAATVGSVAITGRIESIGSTSVTITSDGLRRTFKVTRYGSDIFVDGTNGPTALTHLPRHAAPTVAAPAGALIAPLPGRIVEVYVGVGDTVIAGETLVTIEAMKLEHRVVAPAPGTVTSIAVEVGDQVTREMPLLQIEEAP